MIDGPSNINIYVPWIDPSLLGKPTSAVQPLAILKKRRKVGWINFCRGELDLFWPGFLTMQTRAQFRLNSLRLHNA